MPEAAEDVSRLKNIVNQAKQSLINVAEDSLNQAFDQDLPQDFRFELIHSLAQQIAQESVDELSQAPQAKDLDYSQAVTSALDLIETKNNYYASLLSPSLRKQIKTALEKHAQTQDPQQAKKLAQAAHQLDAQEKPADSDEVISQIFTNEKDRFGQNQAKLQGVLNQIVTHPDVINNPVPAQVESSIQDLIADPEAYGLDPNVGKQIGKKLLNNSELVHHYARTSTNQLPRQTLFTPWQPKVDQKTFQQARHLGASPLALAYTKAGFKANDKKLSKDLQAEVGKLQQVISNPFDPKNNLSFQGHLAAAALKPQVFVAQELYHPVYKAHQKALSKANDLLEHPFNFYSTANKKYTDFKKEYQKYIKKEKLGWLLAPRMRATLVKENIVNGTKTRWRQYVLKDKNRRRRIAKLRLGRIKAKTFISNWSPGGIRLRFRSFVIRKAAHGLVKSGTWLAKKSLTKGLGKLFLETGKALAGFASVLTGPLFFLKLALGLSTSMRRKLKKQKQKDKLGYEHATTAVKAFQAILTGLKSLLAFGLGSIWGLAGSLMGAALGFFIGSSILPVVGTIVGPIIGFFAGGLLGSSLGALVGYSLPGFTATALGLGTFLSELFGSLAASAPVVATTAIGAGGGVLVLSTLVNHYQIQTINSAFYLPPEDSFHQLESTPQSYQCDLSNQPPPNPENVLFSSDKRYAFPVPPVHSYGCTHWGSTNTAADIFVATSVNDEIIANPIVSYTSGIVAHVETDHEYAGINLSIRGNDGRTYYYSHACAIYVEPGQSVSAGQIIATTDKTGLNAEITPEHLHFEIYQGGQAVCAQTDFEEKFNLNKCSPSEQCAAP